MCKKGGTGMKNGRRRLLWLFGMILFCLLVFPCTVSASNVSGCAPELLRQPDGGEMRGQYRTACALVCGETTVRTDTQETLLSALARRDEDAASAARKNGISAVPVRQTPLRWEKCLIPCAREAELYSGDALYEAFSEKSGALSLTYVCYAAEAEAVVLPYETEYRENDEGFDGIRTMISPGENGLASVVWNLVLDPETGKEMSRSERSRTVIKESVNAVSYKGKFMLSDPSLCTGTFAWPLPDNDQFLHQEGYEDGKVPLGMTIYISSLYGGRDLWGEYDFHLGLDIAAPYRTPIYACDGGVVVYSHYTDSYGYAVRILHKDGVETLYAHMNQRMVKDGDFVRQGELIGYVGMTGNASGSHLHLEFRRDHVTCDPNEFITIPDNVSTFIW